MACACSCARWDRLEAIFLLRFPEFAAFQHDPEHGVLVGLLVDEAQRVGVGPPSGSGHVSIGEVLPFGCPLAPVCVPQAAVEFL